MTFKLFQKFIVTVDKNCSLYMLPDTYYSKWKVGEIVWTGMKSRVSDRAHGVARYITPDGRIVEGCFKDGLVTGLSREIENGSTKIDLCKAGVRSAQFSFDADFKEYETHGKGKLFDDLTAEHFNPKVRYPRGKGKGSYLL